MNRYTSDSAKTNLMTKYTLIIVETEIFTSFCHDDPHGDYRAYGAILAEEAQKLHHKNISLSAYMAYTHVIQKTNEYLTIKVRREVVGCSPFEF